MSDCSTLELLSSDFIAIDGYEIFLRMHSLRPYEPVSRYEFASNEFVNSLACVPLETLSTESGHKDFIAVGTTINRGEDLAVKGAVRSRYPEHARPLLISVNRRMCLKLLKLCPILHRT
jgi:cleavage and polyadenylation specificity factor subunit 1